MKTITVVNEKWFSTAPLDEIVLLGMGELDIPPQNMQGKEENSRRALVRQVYKQRELTFPCTFEINDDASRTNPFTKRRLTNRPTKVRQSLRDLKGQYRVVKCRMRAPDNDEKWHIWLVVAQNTDYETCLKKLHEKYGERNSFPSTGNLTFSLESFMAWATTCGWICRV